MRLAFDSVVESGAPLAVWRETPWRASNDLAAVQSAVALVLKPDLQSLAENEGQLGHTHRPGMLERLRRRESGARAVDWIESRARRIGPAVIVPSYFVPFGVVAATLLCGALRMRLGPVVVSSTVGAALWSAMFVLLGYAGGAVTHNPLTGALLALPVALAIGALLSRVATARTPG